MTTLSQVHCDFCGIDAASGRGFLTGKSSAVCEQCIRGMYWRIQEERWPGKCWRALGFDRARSEVEARLFLAAVPSAVIAWVTVQGLLEVADGTPWVRRAAMLSGVSVITATMTPLLVVAVEHALRGKNVSAIIVWAVWLGAAWLIWSPVGWMAGAIGVLMSLIILYFALRMAKRPEKRVENS